MKKSEEQAVGLIIQAYFRQDKPLKEQQEKLIKIAAIYAKQGWQRLLIQQIYSIFKRVLGKKDTFSIQSKRLLRIWDEILEQQVKKNMSSGYRSAISEIIVECYTFIFPLIFEYRCLDLILDFKVYRMLWAKCITDDAFNALRTEISKNHRNFDLNKGFTAENIERIKKRFAKKGFSQEEVQKYMGVTPLQRRGEPSPSNQRRVQERYSSEDEEDVMKKRVKQDLTQYGQGNYAGLGDARGHFGQEQYLYQQNNAYVIPQSSAYPNRPPQNVPPSFPNQSGNLNLYSPFPRQYPNPNFGNPPPMHYPMPAAQNPQYFPQPKPPQPYGGYSDYSSPQSFNYGNSTPNPYPTSSPSFTPPPNISTSFLPQANFNAYPPSSSRQNIKMNDFPNSRDIKRQSPEFTPKNSKNQYYPSEIFDSGSTAKTDIRSPETYLDRSEKERYRAILANLKKGMNECKQCGMHFLSKENLEEHKKEHFQEAQKRFLTKEAETLGNALGIQKQKPKSHYNFDMLCNINQWVLDSSQREGNADYQVSIKRLPHQQRVQPIFYCYFCNEDMEIIWCDHLQEWTLSDGVKVREPERGLCVAHFDCYECFRAENLAFPTSVTA